MNDRTLFLAWQDKARTREWFPVGRLDVQKPRHLYRFRYLRGAERARREAGFEPLFDFPDLHKSYEASNLFPLFQNRVLTPGRKDFREYLRQLGLPEQADPIEILSVAGGYRATDSFEVFPRIERRQDGAFCCRFFLHGWRHVSDDAQRRLRMLKPGDKLYVAIELTNPVTQLAVQIQTADDYYMIGWAPRYLVHDLVSAIAKAPAEYKATVVRVNPLPAPSKQRLLVELSGHWPGYEPMTTEDFKPLAN
ncbi:MAG TPA: HIRAN domain-containing protein [Terriglobia bacterium]|nr:HIRAN domain-containing protein [Terriglobia bacterium]